MKNHPSSARFAKDRETPCGTTCPSTSGIYFPPNLIMAATAVTLAVGLGKEDPFLSQTIHPLIHDGTGEKGVKYTTKSNFKLATQRPYPYRVQAHS